MAKLFAESGFAAVVHLGAQAGVRYSLSHPHVYVDSNVRGMLNVLEGCRRQGVAHLVFASTSSVYGLNTKMPFSPHDGVDHPVSLYASTKRAGELMGHNYAELFGVPFTALRFFTVYGPWGRPDMSPTLFASRILAGEPVNIFNGGKHTRDFTYIDDIVEALCRVIHIPAVADARWNARSPDPASSRAPFRVYNIGRGQPVELLHFVELLGRALGREVKKNFLPMQAGDVEDTWADVGDLEAVTGFSPLVSIESGVEKFARWFSEYHEHVPQSTR